jgi:ribonuclease HI
MLRDEESWEAGGRSESSCSGNRDLIHAGDRSWLNIWDFPCPNKVKMFLWQFAHNILALKRNLVRKRDKIEDTRCLMCNRFDEDGAHLFMKCKKVKVCWRGLGLEIMRREMAECVTPSEVLEMLWKMPLEKQLLIIILWWQWWDQRNKFRMDGACLSEQHLVHVVKCYAAEYLELFVKAKDDKLVARQRWMPPQQEWLKVNVDRAFRENLCRGGWGCIIRDAEGHMVVARTGNSNRINCASVNELMAVREALKLAEELRISKLIVESDAMLLVQAINRREEYLSASAVIIQDIKAHMSLSFNRCVVQFVKRDCNMAAHLLAQYGVTQEGMSSWYWDGDVPAFIAATIMGDLPRSSVV